LIEKLFTIGVYGKSERQFFDQLEKAGVNTLCDIRLRRAVRGSQYAFANSQRLQSALAARGITYRHVPELAPTREIIEAQHKIDRKPGNSMRTRVELSLAFQRQYTKVVLDPFDSRAFCQALERRVALLCVEASAGACHRGLVANRLHADCSVPVEHL
jgi:uncharacterized protein (DUF488 family)